MPKKTFRFIALLLVSLCLSGCLGGRETDEMAYVVAMGVDKGQKDKIAVTFQIANPQSNAAGGGGGGGGQTKSVILMTVEGPTLFACINIANTVTSRELNLMHCKAIFYGEDIAKNGLEPFLGPQVRFREMRRSIYIFTTRGKVRDYLELQKPELELNLAKYYELQAKTIDTTGFAKSTQLTDFYDETKSLDLEGTMPLAASRKDTKKLPNQVKPTASGRTGNFIAGEAPRLGEQPSEYAGTALYKGSKLIGEITGEETRTLSMLKGIFDRGYFSVIDPKHPGYEIAIVLKQGKKPDIKVDLENKTIHETIYLEGEFESIQSGENYENINEKPGFEKYLSSIIENNCNELIQKLQQNYGVDSVGFGKVVKRNYLSYSDWEKSDWLAHFPEYEIRFTVKSKIRRTGLIAKTNPVIQH